MGLTFTLTSFACIGPIVGPLLVASVQTSGLQPVFGMASFATGLAARSSCWRCFRPILQKLPKSGGWLMRVKVVLGFVVLAISLKYLSSADQILQTDLISRELFLAAWIVLFALPGLYLLGFLRLEGVKPDDRLGVGRMLFGALFLIFSISLLPGLFGSYARQHGGVHSRAGERPRRLIAAGEGGAPVWMKNQYKEALAKARAENKLVFINFTGYACTNCHWMKANMFPRPEIVPPVEGFRSGGPLHRRHRQRFRREPAIGRETVRDRCHSLTTRFWTRRSTSSRLSRVSPGTPGNSRIF